MKNSFQYISIPILIAGLLLASVSCKKSEKIVQKNTIDLKAEEFPLSDTRLLEGSPFKHAMDKNGEWLLELEPDRFLHRFHLNAGLEPKGELYGGWESMGVSGHTLGHYLSACSRMYAASGDNRFKEKVDYIIEELGKCQKARKTGYIGGIPDEDRIWDEVSNGDIRSQGFDLNGGWVPWYTEHKIWAGLIDAYLFTGNEKAKNIVIKLSDWAVDKFGHLSEEQFQNMLACEFGGMNESFAEMYAITGNKSYLDMAEKFYHKAILDPLKSKRDELAGKHSNTQVPKVIGAARMYELTGNRDYQTISSFYWDQIVNHHSYVNGGNSDHEHLGEPDCLNDRLSASTSETCNTHNILKLTKHLFSWDNQASYMDYYERALYNHILASQNPDDGMVFYFAPLASGTEKAFSGRFDSFWCCVGSGIENHVRYAESVFYKSKNDNGLIVNLFIPTALHWKERNMDVKMETNFPVDDKIKISFKGKKQKFPVHFRYPKWATSGMKATIDGKEENTQGTPGSYVTIDREWGDGSELIIELPMDIYTESMPDNADRIGIFYGPILLCAGLGNGEVEPYDIPVIISSDTPLNQSIKPIQGQPLAFTTGLSTNIPDRELIPFYKMKGQKHAIYFDVFSQEGWNKKEKEYQKLIEQKKSLEARTIDHLRIGEMQPKRDHQLQSENSNVGNAYGNKYRDASNGGWFSFTSKVDAAQPVQMLCSYWGGDNNRNFDIYIDDELFRSVSLKAEHGLHVFDEIYDVPIKYTKGKDQITVRFQSLPDNFAGGLFGFRIMKKK